MLGWACQDPDGTAGDDGSGPQDPMRAAVLQSIATEVIVPHTDDFVAAAQPLVSATQSYAQMLANASEPWEADDIRLTAQAAWRTASLRWQRLELMQVGPAAGSLVGIGGEDLRDEIYSWPTADSCSVDRALVDEAYASDDFYSTELVWSYGLDALEYLLFADGTEHTCPSQVQLDGPWNALSSREIERRRAEFAAVIAQGVWQQAEALQRRWSPDRDDFATALASPGAGDSPYASQAEALDEVFRAMFYIDKQTKDGKLGTPLGLVDGCPTAPCVELMEAPWSGTSAAAVAENLRALKLMVQGGPDPDTATGFDDLLVEIGEDQIASDLLGRIDAAIAVADAIDAPLQELAVSDPARVEALHTAVKEVTDVLKGPFVMALTLTVPAEGAGDID